MKDKPVDTYVTILRLLLPNQLSVNQLYKQTGLSYKQRVTQSIKDLEKGELVKRAKDNNHVQREYIQLTRVGYALAHIMIDIENYKESYFSIHEIIKKFYYPDPSLPRKTIEAILRSRGLSDREIKFYDHTPERVFSILLTLEEKFFDAISIRFILKLLKKYPSLSDIATVIMNNIFTDVARFRLSQMLDDYKDYDEKLDEDIGSDYLLDVEDLLGKLEEDTNYPFFGEVLNRVINAYTNYLMLIRPRSTYIESELGAMLLNYELSKLSPKETHKEVIKEEVINKVAKGIELKFADILSSDTKLPTAQMESYRRYLTKVNAD